MSFELLFKQLEVECIINAGSDQKLLMLLL